jgi:virginiamycin B lyase
MLLRNAVGPSFAVIAIVSVLGASPAHGAPAKPEIQQQPLAKLPIVERIRVPVGPAWLETGFDSVWLTKIKSKTVFRIDPATNKVVARIPVGSNPELGIGIGLGFAWVPDTKDRTLTQIDPKTNRVVRVIPVNIPDDTEGSIGVGEGSVWVLTNEGGTDSGTLSRIDPVSGHVVANVPVKPKSHAAVVAFGAVWVTSTGAGRVVRVDPATNAVVAEIAVHAAPRFLAGGEGSIWVLSQSDGTLARIDPATNRVVATINVGVPGEGGDLSIAEHYVWVAAERIPLSQVDPATNKVLRQFAGGRHDDTMRVGFGAAWIVDENHGQIWRIDLNKLAQTPAAN